MRQDLQEFFHEQGYVVLPQLFSADEVRELREHLMRMREKGTYPGDMVADADFVHAADPLLRYPRLIHMHRWDSITRNWLLDTRLRDAFTALWGAQPYAVQSMCYFKPPGARGQAMHQDNFYLQAAPGTCGAAWLALDPCDEENGCLQVIPGSHRWPLLCTDTADSSVSFTSARVPLPELVESVPVEMEAGDVLFFGGALVHGSYPNTSSDRFRRALIGHFVEAGVQSLTQFDQPVLRMDGTEVFLENSADGAPCGVWTDRDGTPVIELSGNFAASQGTE